MLDRQTSQDRYEQSARRVDLTSRDLLPPNERFLHDIFGICRTTEHAVCNGKQERPMLIERVQSFTQRIRPIVLCIPGPDLCGGLDLGVLFVEAAARIARHMPLDSGFHRTLQDSRKTQKKQNAFRVDTQSSLDQDRLTLHFVTAVSSFRKC